MVDDSIVEIRRKLHGEQLCQAYGFYPDTIRADSVRYPVGVSDEDAEGWTTIHHAAASDDTEVLSDIISQDGFNHLEVRTNVLLSGMDLTPLLCCCHGNAPRTFDMLVAHGADIGVQDSSGRGVLEVVVVAHSTELLEHLLQSGYAFNGLPIWETLMRFMLNSDENRADLKYSALKMILTMVREQSCYARAFIAHGGFNVLTDLLQEFVGLPRTGVIASPKLTRLVSEVPSSSTASEKDNAVFMCALKVTSAVLQRIRDAEWRVLYQNYSDLVTYLARALTQGYYTHQMEVQISLLAIAQCPGWGMKLLLNNDLLHQLLRTMLLDNECSYAFPIVEAMYKTEPEVFVESITVSEVEILRSLLNCEKSISTLAFVVEIFFKILIQNPRCKEYIYTTDVIESLLKLLSSPEKNLKGNIYELLELIIGDKSGLQVLFASPSTFQELVTQVGIAVDEEFFSCCRMLWTLALSCSALQDSVRLIENIGVSNVIRMIECEDLDIVCIGAECIKILLSSNKHDYHLDFELKDIPAFLLGILETVSRGDVIFSCLTALAELAVSWSIIRPISNVQSLILKNSGFSRALEVVQASKFSCSLLQSAALKLIATTLFVNSATEKRLSETIIDIDKLLKEQTRHTPLSEHITMESVALLKTHDILRNKTTYKKLYLTNINKSSYLQAIQCLYSENIDGINEALAALIETDTETSWKQIATLAQFELAARACSEYLDHILKRLQDGSYRIKQSVATLLAVMSRFPECHESLFLLFVDDPSLRDTVAKISDMIPLSEGFLSYMNTSTVKDQRRSQLKLSERDGIPLPQIMVIPTTRSRRRDGLAKSLPDRLPAVPGGYASTTRLSSISQDGNIPPRSTTMGSSRPWILARELSVIN